MNPAPANFDQLIVTPEFVADPYPVLARLRAADPVYWSDAIGGWILTAYADILVAFKDPNGLAGLVRARRVRLRLGIHG